MPPRRRSFHLGDHGCVSKGFCVKPAGAQDAGLPAISRQGFRNRQNMQELNPLAFCASNAPSDAFARIGIIRFAVNI